MLRLSKLTDYGMVLMADLAGTPETVRNAVEIAKQTRIAAPTVRKLLKRLAQAGLVNSARGVNGGYRLAHAPETISVTQIITALEGPIGLTECSLHGSCCNIESDCRLRGNWQVITKAIRAALADVTLADMAQPIDDLQLQPVPRRAVARH